MAMVRIVPAVLAVEAALAPVAGVTATATTLVRTTGAGPIHTETNAIGTTATKVSAVFTAKELGTRAALAVVA